MSEQLFFNHYTIIHKNGNGSPPLCATSQVSPKKKRDIQKCGNDLKKTIPYVLKAQMM